MINIELYKIRKRPRSYIGFAAIAVVVSIIQFALYVDGEDYVEFITMQIEQTFTIDGTIINGNLVAYVILQMLIVQMPLLVAIVTGDLVSGEAANGTIRLLATKPVSRHNIIMAKFIAGSVYTIMLILWLGIFSLGLGLLFFGNGDLIVLNSDGISILRSSATFPRFMAAMVVAFVSLTVVGTFSMMLSCFSDNSLGPILATMSVIIIFTIIGTMDIPIFDKIKPYLFTTHMIIWRNMFEDPLNTRQIITSVSILVGHIIAFMTVSLYYFKRKDILN